MRFFDSEVSFDRLPSPLPIYHAVIDGEGWSDMAAQGAAAGVRLVSLWGSERSSGNMVVCAAYATAQGLLWVEQSLSGSAPSYLDISRHFPAAGRMQRAAYDLLGLIASGHVDKRPWLRHGAWPARFHPLRRESDGNASHPPAADDYAFVPVEGDGVHEIAVGPVHAGIIEPGHFRFSVVGERVLRLEQRLGYKHKGIDKRFVGMDLSTGARLAGRVSGDSTVAYAWAFAMAAECLHAHTIPERATWLRAVMLERERVANHLGDLGALANDAAFGFGLAQFMRLKEFWLRLNGEIFGHRLLMDRIIPGGMEGDPTDNDLARIARQCEDFRREVDNLRQIYDEHAGMQDRFITLGRITPELAQRLGATGLAGRASNVACDLRGDFAWQPYDQLDFRISTQRNGDVAARVNVRFDELEESLRLLGELVTRLPAGPTHAALPTARPRQLGAGWVEGWRGEIFVALELDQYGKIRRCHCHDPSWQNWPLLEHAIIGDIVPDFPLINKSFNLSYSGQDL